VIEAAWSYRFVPASARRAPEQKGVSEEVKEIDWKAQNRLLQKYQRLMAAGKDQKKNRYQKPWARVIGFSSGHWPGDGNTRQTAASDDGVIKSQRQNFLIKEKKKLKDHGISRTSEQRRGTRLRRISPA